MTFAGACAGVRRSISRPLRHGPSTRKASDSFNPRRLSSSATAKTHHDASQLLKLNTRPVPEAPPALASSPEAFLEYVRSPTAAPFLLRAQAAPATNSTSSSRAEALMRTLRKAGDRLVEVEVGRYDTATGGGRVEVPLGVYLDWLAGEQGGAAGEKRMQLYLAQWRARDEIPGLVEVVEAPALLAPLLESQAVDLYQSSFFVGPSETVTPLHYDPYFNLYNVYASSDPAVHAKHFVLFPPALSEYLARADDGSVLRNTSPVDFRLHSDASGEPFEIVVDKDTAPLRTREALVRSDDALSCVVREGDTLFVPRRWWHRVQNVTLREPGSSPGWTAGVGWWFLPRSA